MKKKLLLALLLLVSFALCAQKDGDSYIENEDYNESEYREVYDDIAIVLFVVDGVDRTAEIARAVYIFDFEQEYEELFLYDANNKLIEHIGVGDYEVYEAEDDYEVVLFYTVETDKLSLSGGEELIAYAEYDYEYGFYWAIYNANTEEIRIEIEAEVNFQP